MRAWLLPAAPPCAALGRRFVVVRVGVRWWCGLAVAQVDQRFLETLETVVPGMETPQSCAGVRCGRNGSEHSGRFNGGRAHIDVHADDRGIDATAARVARIQDHGDADLHFSHGQSLDRCAGREPRRQIEHGGVEPPIRCPRDLGRGIRAALRETLAGHPHRLGRDLEERAEGRTIGGTEPAFGDLARKHAARFGHSCIND